MSQFIAYQVSLELVRALTPVIRRIERCDKDLARQLRRAASSVVLNLAEGSHSDGGNRRARYFTAAGSAKETQAALHVAVAWGYADGDASVELADRVVALTYRLVNRRLPATR